MPHIILNELVVRFPEPEERKRCLELLCEPDIFETILPIPESVSARGDAAVTEWCERHWGTAGLCSPLDSISLETETMFGDTAGDLTIIATFLTTWTPPDGIILALSGIFPDASFDLRFLDYDDDEGDIGWYRVSYGSQELRLFSHHEYPDYRSKLLRIGSI